MRLPEHFSGDDASGLIADFMSKRGSDLVIDASGVEGMDTPGVEVLAAAASQWRSDRRKITYKNPSPSFCQSLSVLGISVENLENSRK